MRYVMSIIVATALTTWGCSTSTSTSTPTTEPVNAHCPIMGGEVQADGGTAVWNEQTIGFCCPECIPAWNRLTDEEKAAKLEQADGGETAHEQANGHEPA